MSIHEGDDPRDPRAADAGSGGASVRPTPAPGTSAAGAGGNQPTSLPFMGTGDFLGRQSTTGATSEFPPPRRSPTAAEREAVAGLAPSETPLTLGMLQLLLQENNKQIMNAINNQPQQKEERRRAAVEEWGPQAAPELVASFQRQGFSKQEAEELARRQTQPVPSSSTQSAPGYQGRRKFEVKDVGTFDGDASALHEFLSNIESIHDMREEQPWRDALFDVIPLCLKGPAKAWLNGLPRTTRTQLVTSRSLAVWKWELKRAFYEDIQDLRQTADARFFDWEHEPVNYYFWSKVELMRRAYPARGDDIAYDIIMGLPTDFQLLVRTDMVDPLKPPALEDVLAELRKIETKWRRVKPERALKDTKSESKPPSTAPHGASASKSTTSGQKSATSSAPAGQKSYTTVQTSPAAPATSTSSNMSSTRASYNPKNIFYSGGVRHYRHPADGRIMRLQYPCHCGEDEFNFEHGQPNWAPIKKPTAALMVDIVDGYPVFAPNSITADDMDTDSDYDGSVATPPTSPEVGTAKSAKAAGKQKEKSGGAKSART